MDVRVATEHQGAAVARDHVGASRRAASTRPRCATSRPRSPTPTERTKLILFRGDGDDFALGGDAAPAELHALFRRLIALGVPTAAVVRGGCLGPALELAAFCNFVFAARDARFGACPLPAFVLPLKLGQGNAEDLLFCGDALSAGRGLSPRARARHGARRSSSRSWPTPGWPRTCSTRPPASLRRANRVARASFHTPLASSHAAAFDLAASARAYSASHVPRLHRS